jgi:uncharacterized protein (DUF58 family)
LRAKLAPIHAGGALRLGGLGLGLVLIALLFDCEPLYVPGGALLAVAIVAVAWVALGATGARVERSVGAKRASEGEAVHGRVVARAGVLGLLGAQLDDALVGDRSLPWRREVKLRVDARFSRRGRRELPPPAIVFADPLRLARARVVGDGPPESLLILPRIAPVVAVGRDGEGDGTGAGGRRSGYGAAEVEIDGLRPAQEGSPASRIHWPSLARGVGLMERRLRPEADARPMVALDARMPASGEALDAAVRATASLAVHLARGGGVALLLPGDRRPVLLESDLHGWAAQHVRLALLEAGGGPVPAAVSGRRGPLLLVVAHVPARVPRLLAGSPSARRVLIVPGAMGGRRPSFRVAECEGYVLGGAGAIREAA